MAGQYGKDVAKCIAVVLLGWQLLELSPMAVILLFGACLIAPLVYWLLAWKFSSPPTDAERRNKLRRELLRGVAYKPQNRRLLEENDSLFNKDRPKK